VLFVMTLHLYWKSLVDGLLIIVTSKTVHIVGTRDGVGWYENSGNWELWKAIKPDFNVLYLSA